jgi:hypothetical protein
VEELSKYTARVQRDGKFWLIRVPEINRSTQARTIDEIGPMARDLIALMEDVPADSFELEVVLDLPPDIAAHIQRAAFLRDEIDEITKEAGQESRVAAKMLSELMPMREVGKVLGVSHQRVHQLVNS